ncbi:MAG: hypothetical protein EXR69_10400 [Myxococcales bacterium]|nr:hypothetical protein [Myxococcales bacterium]
MLFLLACAADLLPGEVVVGADVPADVWHGAPGERFGASIAGIGQAILAAAPGVPALKELEAGGTLADVGLPAVWVGLGAGGVYAAGIDGTVWVEGIERFRVPGAIGFAVGDDGVVVGTREGWELPESGVRLALAHVSAVGVGVGRVLGVVCDPECAGRAWDLQGNALAIELPAGEGGAIAEWAGTAWAGDPQNDVPDGAGRVCNEMGDCIEGYVGDHLGRAFGGGYAVGTFNKWVVPARARFVPLGGGDVLALESGAEDQPLAAAGDDATVWLGAPYYEADGEQGGAVFGVQRP